MARSWTRMLKSVYRREPISSFILTVGAVDAVIGGVGDRMSLMAFGLGAVGIAMIVRVWMTRERPTIEFEETRTPVRYLPSQSSSSALPPLNTPSRKRPRSRH